MHNHDAIKFSVFGKQPDEELTEEEAVSMQALDAGEPILDYTPDLDDVETKKMLGSLYEYESRKEENWQRFKEHKLGHPVQEENQNTIPVRPVKWIRILVAAAILVPIALWTWPYFFNSGTAIPDISPGEKNAILFLSDNRTISIKSDESRFPVHEKGALISKLGDSMIAYSLPADAKQPFFNKLVTQAKQEYGVRLPDGSIAWLNNGSTLRYPATFIHKDSAVELSGEAYFEVNKNRSTPFRVHTLQNTQIIATGTRFNIKAYRDDSTVLTTLIEGSVWVRVDNDSSLLSKGQQAITNRGVLMPPVNINDLSGILAWKNGNFSLKGESIRSLMKQITRWYDVEVDYRGNVHNDTLWGNISRSFNLNQAIGKLKELDQSFQFEWIDNKLVVSESTD